MAKKITAMLVFLKLIECIFFVESSELSSGVKTGKAFLLLIVKVYISWFSFFCVILSIQLTLAREKSEI